jgi:hypothetical protein
MFCSIHAIGKDTCYMIGMGLWKPLLMSLWTSATADEFPGALKKTARSHGTLPQSLTP